MDKIFRERYLIGLKGSREQAWAKLFWLDIALMLIVFPEGEKKPTMFLRGLNTDDRKICIPEKILFFPISEGRTTCPGKNAGRWATRVMADSLGCRGLRI